MIAAFIFPEHSRMISHDEQVDRQFGPVAAAYLSSQVHSQGADLGDVADKLSGAARVLDVGCGAGHLSFAVARTVGAVVASDLSPEMLAAVAAEAERRGLSNLTTQRASAESLPFEDASFDAVCTRFSAHHWADLKRGIAEMRRVLKPRGRLVVIDVVAPDSALFDTHLQALELLRDPSHVRDHSLAQWADYLGEVGLGIAAHKTWPLRMEFDTWVARMKTPADRVAVLRGILKDAPAEVREHFNVGDDCSFDIQTAMIECRADQAGACRPAPQARRRAIPGSPLRIASR
jgi:ubiquinone/menaquinone biosynthesis C-methylase UbiE